MIGPHYLPILEALVSYSSAEVAIFREVPLDGLFSTRASRGTFISRDRPWHSQMFLEETMVVQVQR